MRVNNVGYMPSFGYHNILKTEWLKGKLPTVKRGFYGDILTKETVSLEHLDCVCNGGETVTSNLVLASKKQNNLRGNKDLKDFFKRDKAIEYLEQFIGVKTKRFNGDDYIRNIIKRIKGLGIDLKMKNNF